jgi:hypothetical protein
MNLYHNLIFFMYSYVLLQLVPRFETIFYSNNNEKTSKFTIEKNMFVLGLGKKKSTKL